MHQAVECWRFQQCVNEQTADAYNINRAVKRNIAQYFKTISSVN